MQISHFFNSLDREQKILLLLGGGEGGLHLPFDQATVNVVKRFISSAVGKIHRLRKEMLRELEAHSCPTKYICNFLFYLAIIDIMYFNTSFFM